MLLLVLSGLNMLIFELTAGRTIHQWDQARSAPATGKAAAALSLALWIGVIFMGRWIGFTTTRGVAAPPPADVNFEDFLQGTPEPPSPPPDSK
jgi:hypothetical protein